MVVAVPVPPHLTPEEPRGSASRVSNYSSRTTRHGFPTAGTPLGMSRVTTLAPTMESSPIETPGNTMAAAPIQTFDPIEIGRANSRRSLRVRASRGWSAARSCTPGPIWVTDRHRGAIQDHGIGVDERVVADRHVVAVVVSEWTLDERAVPDPTEELSQKIQALLLVRLGVERVEQRPATPAFPNELRIGRPIQLPGQHLVLLGPSHRPSPTVARHVVQGR